MSTDVEFDEFCDSNNPRKITYDAILAAAKKIVGAVVRTPCTKANMSEKLGMQLYLKQEFRQFTGNFKERGVRNTLMNLSDEQKKFGVITASTGNHAIALIYHTKMLGVPCLVVMSTTTSPFKLQKCQQLGGNIVIHGNNIAEAKRHAMTIRKEKNMLYINGYDHPQVIEGQGTIAIEILDELPTTDAIVVPVGGGSLICGIAIAAKHLKPDIEIFGIETDKTCSMSESFRKNERIFLKMDATLADGLTVNMVGVNTFYNLKGLVDKMVVVKEDWVARAILRIIEDEKFIVEGAGATTIAAIMAGLFPNLKGKKYDHPHIMAGQGTVGLEIMEQVPDVDAVLVPVGGGGLLAGVATAIKHLKPHVLIYGVETEKCPSMKNAIKNNEPVSVDIRSTLADGLAVPTVGYNAFLTVKPIIDKLITVNEDWLARAILRLVEQEKYVVEGGGAVGVAAIMAGLVPELAGKKVVCILSGGNIDTTILGRCLERGLAAEQRLVKFKVTVSDRPGGIAELCKLISKIGVSIKDIMQERAWVHGDIFSVRVKVVCETRGPDHLEELREVIAGSYREWEFAREFDGYRPSSGDSFDDVSH